MATPSSVFQAAQAGDLPALRSALEAEQERQQLDLNAKDDNGETPLILACKSGNEEAVRELLTRGQFPIDRFRNISRTDEFIILTHSAGADRHEALAAGYGQDASPVAAVLNDVQGQQQPMFAPIPTDIYGGYQLPDGSIAYGGYPSYPPPFQGGAGPGQPTFYHDPIMFPHAGAQMPYGYPPMRPRGPPGSFPHGMMPGPPFGAGSPGRKPSTVGKFPPPEVAKTIPCRFYPNCRNGSSCIFAHIDSPSGPGVAGEHQQPDSVESGHDAAASLPPPPPSYYGVPGPYPPHFFMMPHSPAGPMGVPYGAPSGPIPLHYQPHEATQPGQMTSAAEVPSPAAAPSAELVEQASVGQEASPLGVQQEQADEAANGTEQPQDAADGSKDAKDVESSDDAQDKKRRQSFNSFLHTHAVPFQPAQLANTINSAAVPIPVGPAAMPGHGYAAPYGGRGKLRGRGGISGMLGTGRSKHERGPCTFFARNACRYGSECLFAHILPDGTDARRLPGAGGASGSHGARFNQQQDPNGVAESSKDATRITNPPRQPSSVPLGPKAKKDAGLPPTPSADVTASAAAQAAQQDGKKDSKVATVNGVVPSKPSATAAAAAAAAGTSGPASNAEAPPVSASQQQASPSKSQSNSHPAGPARKAHAARTNGTHHGNGPSSKKVTATQQRVPNGADFPALPGSPNVGSQTSPATASTPVANSVQANEAAPTTAAPKVNFSAILSAPAPAKKSQEPAVGATSSDTSETQKGSDASVVAEDPPKTNGASTTAPQANGHAASVADAPQNKDKAAVPAAPKAKNTPNGTAPPSKSQAKAWGAKQAPASSANTKDPVVDADDFQLVTGRSHSKRSGGGSNQQQQANGRANFASAAKAAVAA